MNKRRTIMAFVLALSLSLLFTFLVEKKSERTSICLQTPTPTRSVLVATKDLSPGDVIQSANIRNQDWPRALVRAGISGTISDVVGKTVMQKIFVGEPVQIGRLNDRAASEDTAGGIPRGMRAVTLSADETTRMGGLLRVGSLVDVLVSPRATTDPVSVSETIVQGVRVIALGEQTKPGSAVNDSSTWSTLTLLMNPLGAAKVTGAISRGKITLTLRNGSDSEVNNTLVLTPPTRATKKGGYGAKPGFQSIQERPFTVELVSGGKHTSQVFGEVAP